jgi:hypothetical protein
VPSYQDFHYSWLEYEKTFHQTIGLLIIIVSLILRYPIHMQIYYIHFPLKVFRFSSYKVNAINLFSHSKILYFKKWMLLNHVKSMDIFSLFHAFRKAIILIFKLEHHLLLLLLLLNLTVSLSFLNQLIIN